MVELFQYLLGCLLRLLPVGIQKRLFWKQAHLPEPRFYFSGRVALNSLALATPAEKKVILLPDYICNVVYTPFVTNSFVIKTYSTTEYFEPDIEQLQEIVQHSSASTLLLAPIFGADGGQSWITSDEGRDWRERNNLHLIFDACQDISRCYSSQFKGEKNISIISSFNDKSFPGVMGAVVYSDVKDPNYSKASLKDTKRVLHCFLKKISAIVLAPYFRLKLKHHHRTKKSKPDFEYSYCDKFPFDLRHSAATGIQVSIASAGLIFRRIYQKSRDKFVSNYESEVIKTPHHMTAPYLVVRRYIQGVKLKSPYAVHGNPLQSLRPNIKAQHCKGFRDKSA